MSKVFYMYYIIVVHLGHNRITGHVNLSSYFVQLGVSRRSFSAVASMYFPQISCSGLSRIVSSSLETQRVI